jgi:hypothetical protein
MTKRHGVGDGRRPEIERLLSLAEEVGTPPYNYLASKAPLVIDAARKSIGEIREVLGRVAHLEFCLASEEASHSVTCRRLTDAEQALDKARADRDRLAARVAELEAELAEQTAENVRQIMLTGVQRGRAERAEQERDAARELLSLVEGWTLDHGACLSPGPGYADSFGDGKRAAKKQVRAILALKAGGK